MRQIQDLLELSALASAPEGLECFIALNGGFRSSKYIRFESGVFSVTNEIDDSEQELTASELWSESNIGEALDKGALYTY